MASNGGDKGGDPEPRALSPDKLPYASRTFNQLVPLTDQRNMFIRMGVTTTEQLLALLDSGNWSVYEGMWLDNSPVDLTTVDQEELLPSTSAACRRRALPNTVPLVGSNFGGISTIRGPNTIGELSGTISHCPAAQAMIAEMTGDIIPDNRQYDEPILIPRQKLQCVPYFGLLNNSIPNGRCQGKLFVPQTRASSSIKDKLLKRRSMFAVTLVTDTCDEKSSDWNDTDTTSNSGSKSGSYSDDDSEFGSYHASAFEKNSEKSQGKDKAESKGSADEVPMEVDLADEDMDICVEAWNLVNEIGEAEFVDESDVEYDDIDGSAGEMRDGDGDGDNSKIKDLPIEDWIAENKADEKNGDFLLFLAEMDIHEETPNSNITKWLNCPSNTFEVEVEEELFDIIDPESVYDDNIDNGEKDKNEEMSGEENADETADSDNCQGPAGDGH